MSTSTFRSSPQQARLWSSVGGARVWAVVEIEGEVSDDSLRSALEQTVIRHEILRTTFPVPAGLRTPLQAVHTELSPAVTVLTLEHLSHDDAQRRVEEIVAELAGRTPTPGDEPPALTATLLVLGPQRRTLILDAAAVAVDAASWPQLVADLAAFATGDTGTLVDETLQYADFAQWQHDLYETDDDAPAAAGFWAERDLPSIVDPLPVFARPGREGPARSRHPLDLEPTVLGEIARVASRYGVSPVVLCEAAFAAFIARIDARETVDLDVHVDGRGLEELDGALGVFERPLPLRLRIDAADTGFAPFLDQYRRIRDDALRWQDHVPLVGVHAAPALVHGVATVPPPTVVLASSVRFTIVEAVGARGAGGIVLELVSSDGEGVEGASLAFDASMFELATIERLGRCLRMLLGGIAADPLTLVAELPILDPLDGRLVTETFNLTSVSRTGPGSALHRLFEDHASAVPERSAVIGADGVLRYGDLDAKAERLARVLRGHRVGPDSVVGVCLDRSTDAMVAILGIWKAGGAYLPLHPDHPDGRLAYQLEESKSPVLLTRSELSPRFGAFAGVIVDISDSDSDSDSDIADADAAVSVAGLAGPAVVSSLDDLAYVIYTSGSTGLPKGVGVTHANVVNYTLALLDQLRLAGVLGDGEALTFGSVSALSTDLGNTAVFAALASGGCLDLVSTEIASDPHLFRDHVANHHIDVLKITPSHLAALLASEGPDVLPRRLLVTGGEALSHDLAEQVLATRRCSVMNHYGPTETTIGSCTNLLRLPSDAERSQWRPATVPIGRPIANTRVYLLDRTGTPVPPGVAGELHIAGAGVARGYLGQPIETAERFVSEPGAPGRMYRTGDLARWLPDGSIEFLGRIDQQVKVRGFRVEPAEIEAVLARHPTVSQAAVVARPGPGGDPELVAYVVSATTPDVETLRAFVATMVPDYMVPAIVVVLERLPVTASGKIDRLALPAPESISPDGDYVAPRTEIEEKLAAIWAAVLGRDRVGVDDNFFRLGGHSLLATQVIARVRGELAVQVPLHTMFVAPTLGGFASEVEGLLVSTGDGDGEDLAALLAELESMTDEEAEALLGDS